MQTGNFNQCVYIKCISYQRAGRIDAEPIAHRENPYGYWFFSFAQTVKAAVFLFRQEYGGLIIRHSGIKCLKVLEVSPCPFCYLNY